MDDDGLMSSLFCPDSDWVEGQWADHCVQIQRYRWVIWKFSRGDGNRTLSRQYVKTLGAFASQPICQVRFNPANPNYVVATVRSMVFVSVETFVSVSIPDSLTETTRSNTVTTNWMTSS